MSNSVNSASTTSRAHNQSDPSPLVATQETREASTGTKANILKRLSGIFCCLAKNASSRCNGHDNRHMRNAETQPPHTHRTHRRRSSIHDSRSLTNPVRPPDMVVTSHTAASLHTNRSSLHSAGELSSFDGLSETRSTLQKKQAALVVELNKLITQMGGNALEQATPAEIGKFTVNVSEVGQFHTEMFIKYKEFLIENSNKSPEERRKDIQLIAKLTKYLTADHKIFRADDDADRISKTGHLVDYLNNQAQQVAYNI